MNARALETIVLPTGARFEGNHSRLSVEFVTDRIVHVRATRNPDFSPATSLMRVPVQEHPGRISVNDRPDSPFVELKGGNLSVQVDRETGALSFLDASGQPLVSEDPVEPRRLSHTEVITSVADPSSLRKVRTVDGEREVADRYVQRKDRDAWKGRITFRLSEREALYGLGFDESSDLNLRGKSKRLYQHNLRIVIPTLVSTRGYGLLFDAYSAMSYEDGPQGCSLEFDVIQDLDYYLVAGTSMDEVVRGYRQLTGAATMLPLWAFGYVQSKERYQSQAELIETVREFRRRRIPLDCIVQDWAYWLPGQWGGDPDPRFYPDLTGMAQAIHEANAHVMISIWPNPDPQSTTGRALAMGGHTLAGSSFLNPFDAKARETYWRSQWQLLGRHGIDAWWCDSTEPEVADWNGSQRPADADALNIEGLAKLIDPQFLNAYALEDSRGIYENSRKDAPGRRVLNLTRSGYAGSQRTGSVLWTGDVSARWDVLAQQVVALQSISAAGYPYVTFDIGGFFVKRGKQWFWRGDYEHGVEDAAYRELYVRWLQTGAFLPLFRSHGTDTPREPWRFGEPGTPAYEAILEALHLRYQLLPYFYSLAAEVCQQDASFLRPLAFGYPLDERTHDLKTQFLVGRTFMVAPVLRPREPADGAGSRKARVDTLPVYLPRGASWFDFWTGNRLAGGRTIEAEAPLARIPLFVRAGSIVPIGPRRQQVSEQPDAPIELRIYPGEDASFSLYEDEGDGYRYEQGVAASIPLSWDERGHTLTLGARKGRFPGMIEQREFRVILVSEEHGASTRLTEHPDAILTYKGEPITIGLKAQASDGPATQR